MSVVTSFSKGLVASLCVFSIVLLPACSDDDGDKNPPVISNLSHADNEKVIGSRDITFSADVTDDTSVTVTITHNGNPLTSTQVGDTYSVNLTLEDLNNTIVVTAKDTENTTTITTVTLNYPFLALTNGQAASVVIGQPDFDENEPNQAGAVGANGVDKPKGMIVIDGRLYIADSENHRILGFNSIPTVNNQNADFVIGQADFTTNTSGLGANQLKLPNTLATDGTSLFLSQGNFSGGSVYKWNTVPVTNTPADIIIGQSGFGSESGACNQTNFGIGVVSVQSMYVVGNKLIVSDTGNNRVLIWNSIPTTNGAAADLVLGQQDFTHCAANDINNDGVSDAGPTSSTLNRPSGIWSDGTRLAVIDQSNFRVLIWNNFPTSNFQAADIVLGQPDFTTAVLDMVTRSATNFFSVGITSNGNQFFATDVFGNRVLIWDTFPDSINQPADRVIGKSSLTSDAVLSSNASVNGVENVYIYEEKLFVSMDSKHRVLIFEAP